MKNIQALLRSAFNATNDCVVLRLVPCGSLVHASITGEDGTYVTLQSDWAVDLVAEGSSVDEALAALDALCARDFPG